MAQGKTNPKARQARASAYSRPEHARTPLPLSTNGVITNVAITACGAQSYRIKAVAEGTGVAMLQVEFQSVTMQFISCEQVQHVLGLFATARQARMGMAQVHRMPGVVDHVDTDVQTTMTWTRVPMGAAARETFAHPVTGTVFPFVRLTMPPLTFSLLDTTAIETMVEALQKAHKMAILTFDDGELFSTNSARPSWRPPAKHRYRISGTGWITPGPRPDSTNT